MNPHYQRVLEQDRQLWPPVRYFTRAMSAWPTILTLAVFVVGYVAAALVPIGGRYLWQTPLIDTSQQQMLSAWPLTAGAILLAVVILWSATRRLPWRWANLGAFFAVVGLAMVLVTQALQFRSQTISVAAVPISEPSDNPDVPDALSLTYSTRAGDSTDRILLVMVPGSAPTSIALDDLPRWNDTTADDMPDIRINEDPMLAQALGFGHKITVDAYVADGELTDNDDGTQSVNVTPLDRRNTTALPYPADALIALRFDSELEDGTTASTTLWLPFEPQDIESIVPGRFYQVEGLGQVALAFRPATRKLPFAMAATPSQAESHLGSVLIADLDTGGRLLEQDKVAFTSSAYEHTYHGISDEGDPQTFGLEWVSPGRYLKTYGEDRALVVVTTSGGSVFIYAGLVTFLFGVVLDRVMDWLGSGSNKPRQNAKPDKEADAAAA